MAGKKDDDGRTRVAENRRARHEYKIGDVFEAGIALTGTEVKALRSGQANIAESYASSENGGIWLINAYIPEYKQAGSFFQHDPRRPRQLLLRRRQPWQRAVARPDRAHVANSGSISIARRSSAAAGSVASSTRQRSGSARASAR